jgi:redox-sensing transcriptional repressor
MVGILDRDPQVIGETVGGLVVRDMARLAEAVVELRPTIAVITVPDAAAQCVCDDLIATGMQSILSFAPAALEVPAAVEVRHVDLAVEMQMLSFERARNAEAVEADAQAFTGVEAGESRPPASTPIGRRVAQSSSHSTVSCSSASCSAASRSAQPHSKGSVVAP